jgi:Regulator of Chromosome Condensation (RCC1) repeat protein/regulator of chromosome condensation (RCC1) repeat-containing protein
MTRLVMTRLSLSRVSAFGLVMVFSDIGCAALVGVDFGDKVLCTDDCPDSPAEPDEGPDDTYVVEGGRGRYVAPPSGADADGSNPNSEPPLAPVPIGNSTSIVAGGSAACAMVSDSGVTCWGYTGVPGSEAPAPVEGLTNVTAVSIGADWYLNTHLCALLSDGTVSCWGSNRNGELGNGTSGGLSAIPMTVPNLDGATAIAAGGGFTCAIVSGGTVTCWGDLSYTTNIDGGAQVSGPTVVPSLSNAVSVAAGLYSACAVLADGSVSCWGDNSSGQLGNGESGNSSLTPVKVVGLSGVSAVVVGDTFACALLSNDSVQCWGVQMDPAEAEIIDDGVATLFSTVPTAVPNLTGVTQIAAGQGFACAALSNGAVECWGNDEEGQLGNGTSLDPTSNTTGEALPSMVFAYDAAAVAAGDAFACALLSGGSVYCWGNYDYGQPGAN